MGVPLRDAVAAVAQDRLDGVKAVSAVDQHRREGMAAIVNAKVRQTRFIPKAVPDTVDVAECVFQPIVDGISG